MLELVRPIVWFDVETTGVNPKEDRILQLGVIHLSPDGTVIEWSTFINPCRPIPPEVIKKHHITDAMVASAPTFAQVAPLLAPRLRDCDYGGYNAKHFDLPFLAEEFKRVNVSWSYDGAAIVDAYKLYVQKYPHNLAAYVLHMTGTDMSVEAHDALIDIRWTFRAFQAFLAKHQELPRTVRELHELVFPTNVNAIDKEGKLEWRLFDGHWEMAFTIGAHKLLPLRRVPRDYLRWVTSAKCNMSADIKAICAQALTGQFQTRRVDHGMAESESTSAVSRDEEARREAGAEATTETNRSAPADRQDGEKQPF